MWTTITKGEMINCVRDVWRWDYYNDYPCKEEALKRDFPPLPLDYKGNCEHKVGIKRGDKFHCCVCGYAVCEYTKHG